MIHPNKIRYEVECLPEDTPIDGNAIAIASGDDEHDKQVCDKIRADLEHNEWAWCTIKVTAILKGTSLKGYQFLGCCSYESKEQFEADEYYKDMKIDAYQNLIEQANEIKEALGGIGWL